MTGNEDPKKIKTNYKGDILVNKEGEPITQEQIVNISRQGKFGFYPKKNEEGELVYHPNGGQIQQFVPLHKPASEIQKVSDKDIDDEKYGGAVIPDGIANKMITSGEKTPRDHALVVPVTVRPRIKRTTDDKGNLRPLKTTQVAIVRPKPRKTGQIAQNPPKPQDMAGLSGVRDKNAVIKQAMVPVGKGKKKKMDIVTHPELLHKKIDQKNVNGTQGPETDPRFQDREQLIKDLQKKKEEHLNSITRGASEISAAHRMKEIELNRYKQEAASKKEADEQRKQQENEIKRIKLQREAYLAKLQRRNLRRKQVINKSARKPAMKKPTVAKKKPSTVTRKPVATKHKTVVVKRKPITVKRKIVVAKRKTVALKRKSTVTKHKSLLKPIPIGKSIRASYNKFSTKLKPISIMKKPRVKRGGR